MARMNLAQAREQIRRLEIRCNRLQTERAALSNTTTAGVLLAASISEDLDEVVRILSERAAALNTWISHATAARAEAGE